MQWFRHYHGAASDPKFGGIARKTGQTRERVFFVWIMLLESASSSADRGTPTVTVEDIADVLNCDAQDVNSIVTGMADRGMIDGKGRIAKWDERQPERDDSAKRMREKRNRDKAVSRRDGTVTRSDGTVTRQDTDTDTDTERRKSSVADATEADASLRPAPESIPEKPKPVDWDKALFDAAVSALEGRTWPNSDDRKVSPADARSLAGKLKKSRGGNSWEAWSVMQGALTAADRVQFLLGAIAHPPPNATPAKRDWHAVERDIDNRNQRKESVA